MVKHEHFVRLDAMMVLGSSPPLLIGGRAAASRKKTDRRDTYWIARALQTGMTPHEVYIPVGEVRDLRRLLDSREVIQRDFVRWRHRATSQLRASGLLVSRGLRNLRGAIVLALGADSSGCLVLKAQHDDLAAKVSKIEQSSDSRSMTLDEKLAEAEPPEASAPPGGHG